MVPSDGRILLVSTGTTLKNANRIVSMKRDTFDALIDPFNVVILHLLNKRGRKTKEEIVDELGFPEEEVEQRLSES